MLGQPKTPADIVERAEGHAKHILLPTSLPFPNPERVNCNSTHNPVFRVLAVVVPAPHEGVGSALLPTSAAEPSRPHPSAPEPATMVRGISEDYFSAPQHCFFVFVFFGGGQTQHDTARTSLLLYTVYLVHGARFDAEPSRHACARSCALDWKLRSSLHPRMPGWVGGSPGMLGKRASIGSCDSDLNRTLQKEGSKGACSVSNGEHIHAQCVPVPQP